MKYTSPQLHKANVDEYFETNDVQTNKKCIHKKKNNSTRLSTPKTMFSNEYN